jgi:hypothetical protein
MLTSKEPQLSFRAKSKTWGLFVFQRLVVVSVQRQQRLELQRQQRVREQQQLLQHEPGGGRRELMQEHG